VKVAGAGVLAVLAAALAPGGASAALPGTDLQRLSEPRSRNPAILQDKRLGRLAAFDADSSGTTNVYLVRRADPIAGGCGSASGRPCRGSPPEA
jgi:hypothetical protein